MPFTDVPARSWYYGDVEACWRKGLVNGTGDTTFAPLEKTTRAQIVAVLHRLSGSETPSLSATAFGDIRASAWYYNDVLWAESIGLIQGSDDDGDGVYSFRPGDSVTRQEFMVILYRYAVYRGMDTSQRAALDSFADAASVASWARDALSWGAGAGIMKGDAAGSAVNISPRGSVTRAQLAAFLNRLSALS